MKTLFRVLALAVLAACTFESDETFYEHIEQPVIDGTITIDVDAKNDTILIYNPTTFSVNFSVSSGRIERVEILFKGYTLKTLSGPGQTFEISKNEFRTGVFDLVLKMRVDSQSGSIVNRNGGERTLIERAYKLKIDADPPPAPVLTKSMENGFLKISWTRYTKPNFVSYRLAIQTPRTQTRSITITDPASTSYIDSAYTGGYGNNVSYSITTNAVGSSTRGLNVNHPLEFVHTYNVADSTAILRWRKMPFASAFAGYAIMENDVERLRITNLADTSLTLKVKAVLNMSTKLDVQVLPKFPDTQYPVAQHARVQSNTVKGKPLPPLINTLTYNETFQNFFARRQFSGGRLYTVRFDRDFNAIDSFDTRGAMPFRGTHFYYSIIHGVSRRDWISGTSESATIPGITPSVAGAGSNGMVVATWQTARTSTQPAKYYTKLIHIPSATTTWDIVSFSNPHTTPDISTDSKYVYSPSQGILGELSGVTYSTRTTFSSGSALSLDFRPDNEEELLQTNKVEGLSIYNTDLTLLRTIIAPESGYAYESYDPVTKNVLFSKEYSPTLYAIHIDTGEVKAIPAYKTSGVSYKLLDGNLIWGANYLKIF